MVGYRSIIAAAVALIGYILQLVGVELGTEDQEHLVNAIMVIGGIAAMLYYKYDAVRRAREAATAHPAPKG